MEKISFDYDGVLDTTKGKELAAELAKKLGIPLNRIYFTGGRDKWHTIKRLKITKHYDNNPKQIDMIIENTDAMAVKLKQTPIN